MSLRFTSFFIFALLLAPVALSAEKVTEPVKKSPVYSITDFGAVGDGETVNTKAIQAAIDRAAENRSAKVIVPPGTFVTGSIWLKPGVSLIVEKDATLKGSANKADYPWIATRITGFEMNWPAALINADGCDSFLLGGDGTIDGSGLPWWQEYWAACKAEPGGTDPHFKVPRPRLIHLIRCRDVHVLKLLLKDSPFWNLQVTYCDDVEISGIKVRAPHEPVHAASSDGIIIDSTRNVRITDCDIECDDDAISLKSGRDADGLRVGRVTENVEILRCRVGYAHSMVALGSETSGGIRHVFVSKCTADVGCMRMARFKSRMGRGGIVEDVVFENIRATGIGSVVDFDLNVSGAPWVPEAFRTPVPLEQGTPVFRNITFHLITATKAWSAGNITGIPESPLRGITLDHVDIEATKPFLIKNAGLVKFKDVTLNGKPVADPSAKTASSAK